MLILSRPWFPVFMCTYTANFHNDVRADSCVILKQLSKRWVLCMLWGNVCKKHQHCHLQSTSDMTHCCYELNIWLAKFNLTYQCKIKTWELFLKLSYIYEHLRYSNDNSIYSSCLTGARQPAVMNSIASWPPKTTTTFRSNHWSAYVRIYIYDNNYLRDWHCNVSLLSSLAMAKNPDWSTLTRNRVTPCHHDGFVQYPSVHWRWHTAPYPSNSCLRDKVYAAGFDYRGTSLQDHNQ